jgi:hypothetical protein
LGEPVWPVSEGRERERVERLRDQTRESVIRMHARLRAELADGG